MSDKVNVRFTPRFITLIACLFSARLMVFGAAWAETLQSDGVAGSQTQNASDCDARLAELGVLASRPGTEISQYENLARVCPRSPEAFYALGVAYRRLGKAHDARREFTRALDLRDLGAYRIALGVVNLELGNLDEAAQLFAKAAELDPRSTAALQGRASVAASQGDMEKALELLEKAIAIDSNNASLFFNRAVLMERTKNFKDAATDYARVTSIDSAQITAWCRLGMIRFALGETDAAVLALTQCVDRGAALEPDQKTPSSIELANQVAQAGMFLARALGETGESERAELTLRRMIEKNPTDVGLKVSLAEIYIAMKRFDEALSQARSATLIGNSDPRAWSVLGSAALGIGDTVEAQAALAKARSLAGEKADAALINNQGVLQMRLGRTEEAQRLFEHALKIDQQFEPAKNNLENLK